MSQFVGVMSGTSIDAIDCVVADFSTSPPTLRATHRASWPPPLQRRLRDMAAGASLDAGAWSELDAQVGATFAEAIVEMLSAHRISAADITAIGCHGQTLAHNPAGPLPSTVQVGDANIIAERTGVTTVNDFRRRDIAAGGQGAPLAPAFHDATMRLPGESRVVLNLGGIANITYLPAEPAQSGSGFDTGPANCLMDLWARRHLDQPFDRDGRWAASGQAHSGLLQDLLDDAYFSLAPPKSTGTQYFSAGWLDRRVAAFADLPSADIQATLLELTVHSVARGLHEHAPDTQRVLACGGGTRNRTLMARLADTLGITVQTTAAIGLDPDWIEATAFAWLASRTLAGRPGNLPAVTGARGARILGAIHPA